MQILEMRPPTRPRDAAMFDIQIGQGLRLYNLILRDAGGGRFRILAPNAFGKHSATFAPQLAEQITQAAVAALGGRRANDSNSRTS